MNGDMSNQGKKFTIENFKEYLMNNIVPTEAHYRQASKQISDTANEEQINIFNLRYAHYIKNHNDENNADSISPPEAGEIKTLNTPYLFDVWDKMLLLCELMQRKEEKEQQEQQKQQEPNQTQTPDQAKGDLLSNIISRKLEIANAEANQRSKKLYARINYVMSVITRNMTDFVNNYNYTISAQSFIDIFREEGLDIYDFKELAQCKIDEECASFDENINTKYKNAMVGASFKVKVIIKKKSISNNQKNEEPKLFLKQKPYNSEISSYKLAKDADVIFKDDLRRNVRVSPSQSQELTQIISTKKAWHMFTKVNDMLTHVQVFFTYVKEMYANTTINIRNHLDTIYTKEEAQIVYKIKQLKQTLAYPETYDLITNVAAQMNIPIDTLESEMKTQMKTLSDTMFSRASARLYGLINGFITRVIQCDQFKQEDVKNFKEEFAGIISLLQQSISGGGGGGAGGGLFSNGLAYVKNKTVNGLINTWDSTKNLLNMISKTIGQIMRFLGELNPVVAFLLNIALGVASCTMSAVSFASLNVVMGAGMARYCLMSIYLLTFTTQNMEGKVKVIQQKIGGSFDTTDIILTIMQYGAFKELHDVLLEKIESMIVNDGMIEDKFDNFKNEINTQLDAIKSNVSSFKEENMYLFHKRLRSKLFEIISNKALATPNYKMGDSVDWRKAMSDLKILFGDEYTNLQYFLNNTPISSKNLKDAIDLLVGDISMDSRLFPTYFKNDQRLEMNYQITKKFTEPDIRKFVLICLMETFQPEWKIPEDILIFKKWMKGEDIKCLSKKKKNLAIEPVKNVQNILEKPVNLHTTSESLLSVISELTFIEKISEDQEIFVQLRCRILEKAIQRLFESQSKMVDQTMFNNVMSKISSIRAEKNQDFALYKQCVKETASLNDMMDYKLKYSSYTIYFMGSSKIFEDIKNEAGSDIIELYGIQEQVLNQATDKSILANINKNADSALEITAQILITIGFFS